MTMRRADVLVTGTALALIAALIGAPIWDFWHYRTLRASPGSRYPVGLILPRRQPSIAGIAIPAAGTDTRWQETREASAPRATVSAVPVARSSGGSASRATPTLEMAVPTAAPIPSQLHFAPARGIPRSPLSAPEAGTGSRSMRATPAESRAPQAVAPAGVAWSTGMPLEVPPPPPTSHASDIPPPAKPSGSGVLQPGAREPEPQGPSIISLRAEPEEPQIGDAVTVSLLIEGARAVTSLPFHLLFQPDILEFTSSEVGPAVPGSLQPILLASVNPNRPGDLAVGLSFVESAGTYTGGGVVLILHFRSVGAGVTSLEFDRASLRGPTSQPLETHFQNLTLTIL
jgi:hypothetical protein